MGVCAAATTDASSKRLFSVLGFDFLIGLQQIVFVESVLQDFAPLLFLAVVVDVDVVVRGGGRRGTNRGRR